VTRSAWVVVPATSELVVTSASKVPTTVPALLTTSNC
jgi:hypothetical protein